MKKTKLTDISDFKVGDTIEILNKPKYWYSQLNNNNPLKAILNYPHILTIKKIRIDAISCGNYEWDLESIIQVGCNRIEIPETWYVTVTEENKDVLFNWRFEHLYEYCRLTTGYIVGKSILSERGHNPKELNKDFGNEISYEDFKKYILKENIKDQPNLENYGVIGSSELSAYFKNTPTSLDGELTDFIYFIRDNKWENEWLSKSKKTLLSLKEYLELVDLESSEKENKKMNTEKKIIGYKFKSEEFLKAANKIQSSFITNTMGQNYHFKFNSNAHNTLNELNLIDIWCDPVYEEEYKEGDYVIVKSWEQARVGNGITENNSVCLILDRNKAKELGATGMISYKDSILVQTNIKGHYGILPDHIIRKATDEEIKKFNFSELPEINGYEGKIDGNYIKYGCASLAINWFTHTNNRSITVITLSSGVSIDEKQMEAIRKYLKHNKLFK